MPRRQGSGGPAPPPPGSGVQPPGRETAGVCSVSSPICDACYSGLSKLLPHPRYECISLLASRLTVSSQAVWNRLSEVL